MNKTTSVSTKIAIALLLIMGLANIILSCISLSTPIQDHSEFAALHSLAIGIYGLLIIVINAMIIFAAFFLFKLKRWAYFLIAILCVLIIPVLDASDLKEIAFTISSSSNISLTKEILPIVILIFLILGRKDFKKKNTR
jgi:hypothetical protein